MKEYTSCFIGIPLASQYQDDFETILADLSKINPLIETVYPLTPHITTYYLDKQSQIDIPNIAQSLQKEANILNGLMITVGGFGYFRDDSPRVLFLRVSQSDQLKQFNKAASQALAKYNAPDNVLPFHPHMTIGKLKTSLAQESFNKTRIVIEQCLNEVNWVYPITEVCLYGVDSTKSPQFQEKLVRIAI